MTKHFPALLTRNTLPRRLLFVRLGYSALHALFLLLLCWWFQSSAFTTSIEADFIEKSLLFKRKLIHPAEDTSQRFLFLDVSGTKKLVERDGRPGLEVITDRAKLAGLLTAIDRLARNDRPYILCDILLDRQSPDDSLLEAALGKTPRIVTSFSTDDQGINKPVFAVPSAYVGYDVSAGPFSSSRFVKYPLAGKENYTGAPVYLYQQKFNAGISRALGLAWINGHPSVNNIVVDYRIRPYHLQQEAGVNKVIPLEELLTLLNIGGVDSTLYHDLVANRVVVIGDFENDQHDTVIGLVPGPLILANIYLQLVHGDGLITWHLMLAVLIFLTLLSWLLLFPPGWILKMQDWFGKQVFGFLIGDVALYGLIVFFLVFLFFLITDFHINATMLTVYISIVSIARDYWQRKKKAREDESVRFSYLARPLRFKKKVRPL